MRPAGVEAPAFDKEMPRRRLPCRPGGQPRQQKARSVGKKMPPAGLDGWLQAHAVSGFATGRVVSRIAWKQEIASNVRRDRFITAASRRGLATADWMLVNRQATPV